MMMMMMMLMMMRERMGREEALVDEIRGAKKEERGK